MIKQLILPFAGVTAFIILVGIFIKDPSKLGFNKNSAATTLNAQSEAKVKNTKIKVAVADSEEERKRGLSNIPSLGESEGMLFVFDSKDLEPSFWMKDMEIAIDIIWINDGKVAKIDKNVAAPDPNAPDSKLQLYWPGRPIDYVLEVKSGFSDKNGVGVGDPVEVPIP